MTEQTPDETIPDEAHQPAAGAPGLAPGDGTPGAGPSPGADGPPVPDEIREAGRLAPDHWLGMVDPAWTGDGEPPEWATVGRWRSGLDGEIEEWQDNPEYRPSPRALGWPEPEDEVDAAVQLAATGYGPGEAVAQALAGREVAVLTSPAGVPLTATTPEGEPVVPLFTSPVFLHTTGRFAFELLHTDDLLPRVPEGHALYLNPSGPVSMTLDPQALREAADTADTEQAASAEADALPAARRVATAGSDAPGAGAAGTGTDVPGVRETAERPDLDGGSTAAPGGPQG
ncbi:SseB family protein [Streptomyces sp. ISL-12]|uniref:type VII secretion system-associated protein n=1 Tax=Streptomyces sp. ISL-12 TaxID=2819177 RepID=UPI001BE52976|nr:type VII secretion system-associated protein [Streptomyces sp. ISL-12]MBT2413269.1 SseB family protein [Streptomyces sp. ISL-12]